MRKEERGKREVERKVERGREGMWKGRKLEVKERVLQQICDGYLSLEACWCCVGRGEEKGREKE